MTHCIIVNVDIMNSFCPSSAIIYIFVPYSRCECIGHKIIEMYFTTVEWTRIKLLPNLFTTCVLPFDLCNCFFKMNRTWISEKGRVFVLGNNDYGQLGLGHRNVTVKPSCVKSKCMFHHWHYQNWSNILEEINFMFSP